MDLQASPHSKERVEALARAFDRLPEAALPLAAGSLWTCADRSESLPLLSRLVERWAAFDYEALASGLSAYGETPRPQFLAALEILTPIILKVGGEPAVKAAAEAVLEAGDWWE